MTSEQLQAFYRRFGIEPKEPEEEPEEEPD